MQHLLRRWPWRVQGRHLDIIKESSHILELGSLAGVEFLWSRVGLVGSTSCWVCQMIIWFLSVYLQTGAVLNWHQLVWMKHEGGKSSDDGYFHHEYRAFEPRPSRKSFDVPSRLVFFLESSICTTFLNTLDLLCLAKKWSNDDEILGSSSQAPSRSNWKGLGLCFSTILYLCFVPMLDHGCRWN